MKKYKKKDFTTTFENDIELKKSYLPVLYKRGEYKDLFQLHTYYSQNLQNCITKLQILTITLNIFFAFFVSKPHIFKFVSCSNIVAPEPNISV